jgi:transposase
MVTAEIRAWVGIDVSKSWLDVVARTKAIGGKKLPHKRFDNSATGFAQIDEWVRSVCGCEPEHIRVAMESTGRYHEPCKYALIGRRFRVAVVNPHWVSKFRDSNGTLHKTDKSDAAELSFFAETGKGVRDAELPPAEVYELRDIQQRLDALDEMIRIDSGKCKEDDPAGLRSAHVTASFKLVQDALTAIRKQLENQREQHIASHANLKRERELLKTIPGVGPSGSVALLIHLRSRTVESARAAGVLAGLRPVIRESGSSVTSAPRISKAGGGFVRRKLYMCAVVASTRIRGSLFMRQFDALVASGKPKMSALCAVAFKMVRIAWALLNTGSAFNAPALAPAR